MTSNRFFRAGILLLAVFLLFSFCANIAVYSPFAFAANVNLDEIEDVTPAPKPQVPAEAPAANPDPGHELPPKPPNYLVWLVQSCGWFFTPVFLTMSIIMVAFVVINLLTIRRDALHPNALVDEFTKLLDDKKFQEAFELAKENDSLLGKVLAAGLSKVSRGYDQAVQAMQEAGEIEVLKLENRLKILALLGNIAPMVGLFGTVVGMIDSFSTIAVSITTPPAYKLANGIATALFTTEVGLAIAIPSIAFYEVMKNILARFVLEVSITSDNLMSRFKK